MKNVAKSSAVRVDVGRLRREEKVLKSVRESEELLILLCNYVISAVETFAEMVHRSRSVVLVTEINIITIKHASYHRLMFTDTHVRKCLENNYGHSVCATNHFITVRFNQNIRTDQHQQVLCVCSGVCVCLWVCASVAALLNSGKA